MHHGPDFLVVAAQLELGRVYQKQGETKARIAYQNFLAAWKDADPDLPLLREAKAEYAKIAVETLLVRVYYPVPQELTSPNLTSKRKR